MKGHFLSNKEAVFISKLKRYTSNYAKGSFKVYPYTGRQVNPPGPLPIEIRSLPVSINIGDLS